MPSSQEKPLESDRIRVLLVEDCAMIRAAVSALLSQDARIQIVGIAADGIQALDLVKALLPDVIVTDLEMPGMDGAEFVHQQMSLRAVPIIVFSGLKMGDALVKLAMDSGAVDFLRKPAKIEDVLLQQKVLQSKILQVGASSAL